MVEHRPNDLRLTVGSRMVTGGDWVRAYLHIRGRVVWACRHKHRARRSGCAYINGEFYARQCALRELRRRNV